MPMEEIVSRLLLSIIKCKIGMLIVLSSFCPSFLAKCIPIKNVTVDFSSNSSLTGESTVVLVDSPAGSDEGAKFLHKFLYLINRFFAKALFMHFKNLWILQCKII